MKLFAPLYTYVLEKSKHPRAPWFLGGMSFAESSFFPIPPDVMLLPMSLSQPQRWWKLALLTTLASVAGGALGYFIGVLFVEQLQPMIAGSEKYSAQLGRAKGLFAEYGVLVILLAGFTPIPYKIFTITAGMLSMAFLPFVLASLVGRGARFFLVAGMAALLGQHFADKIMNYIEWLGWLLVFVIVVLLVAINL